MGMERIELSPLGPQPSILPLYYIPKKYINNDKQNDNKLIKLKLKYGK